MGFFAQTWKKIWGFAADDTHQDPHAFGGWIVVKARGLSHQEIFDSVKSGNFYSSMGPEIYDFYVEDGLVYVECAPVEAIHFITYDTLGLSYYRGGEKEFTRASHKLQGVEKYVRAVVVDQNGKKAWTNPIFLK